MTLFRVGCYPGICLEGLKQIMKRLRIVAVTARVQTGHLRNTARISTEVKVVPIHVMKEKLKCSSSNSELRIYLEKSVYSSCDTDSLWIT